MGNEILTKCGYRCDLCLAYRPNVEARDERQKLSDGWYALYGFRLQPEDIVCDGCVSCSNPRLIDAGCPVRPCVVDRGIANCACCDEYVCDKLMQRIVSRDEIESSLGRKVTDEEYISFIKPYESRARLDAIRHEGSDRP